MPVLAWFFVLLSAGPASAEAVRLPWNSPKQEFGASLSGRGNLFFYSNRGGGDTDLYQSRRVNGTFKEPEALTALNSPHDDQSPFILPDESGIFFSSNRDGSHEFRTVRGIAVSRDLYFAPRTESGFGRPELLPDTINTDMIEENPFFHGKRLFFIRYPFARPHLARIFYSDLTETGFSEAREAFPFSAITPAISADRFYFARKSEKGDYQIAFIPMNEAVMPDPEKRTRIRPDLDTGADEASYAASEDNNVAVFCRRSSKGDYDLFEMRADPWEQTEKFSLTSILFGPGKSNILPESNAALDKLAAFLNTNEQRILVTGHTDKTGDPQTNLQLSVERAEAVKSALVSRGVKEDRITVEGKGSKEPLDRADSEEAFARNRRTEFRFLDSP
jgi:outer membrane protein OmpA-like peptidoglycan-associated protein